MLPNKPRGAAVGRVYTATSMSRRSRLAAVIEVWREAAGRANHRGARHHRGYSGADHPWNSRIRPRVYRPFEFVIPGTADAADEMVRHIRHRQPLRQSERQWLDIEVTGWLAGRAFDLEEFHPWRGRRVSRGDMRWRSAPALGLVPIPLELDELRQPDDQPGECLRLIIGQPTFQRARS